MKDICHELQRLLHGAIMAEDTGNILFSGGLDTAIIAAILCGAKGPDYVHAITVSLGEGSEDSIYAEDLARRMGFHLTHIRVKPEEAIDAIPHLIRILKSFDPAIPNDLVVYFGLMRFYEDGAEKVLTGDGSDELFGGYDYMRRINPLSHYIKKIAKRLTFNSNVIGPYMGIKIGQPFLQEDVVAYALGIPDHMKINRHNKEVCGKWILRHAYEGILPDHILWQSKRPLEVGSSMGRLRHIISSMVRDGEYIHHDYPVGLMNKEHLYYYRIYREVVGEIPAPGENERPCPACGAGMAEDAFHCRICGNVTEWRL